jgi:prepilin-type N-terminal cleavage/methylation domain-containing protein/prepilin-type processing-associated H-X9-DG protein
MTNKKHKSQFFSLIEMLIVLAILAILVSLLSASLKKVIKRSNTLGCSNSLKNISYSSYLYQDDFNGHMMYQYSKSVGSNRTYFWSEMMIHLGYTGAETLNTKSFVAAFDCPERETAPRRDRTPWGYSLRIANWWSSNPEMSFKTLHSSNLAKPTETFIFVESMVNGGNDDWGFFMINKDWFPNFHGFNPLHMDFGNIAFGDGHIETVDVIDYTNIVALPDDQNPWIP